MAGWMVRLGECCEPLMDLLKQEIRSGPLIGIDETTLQVLKEPGRANTDTSYMWVFRGGPPDQPILIYVYHPSRSGQVSMDPYFYLRYIFEMLPKVDSEEGYRKLLPQNVDREKISAMTTSV